MQHLLMLACGVATVGVPIVYKNEPVTAVVLLAIIGACIVATNWRPGVLVVYVVAAVCIPIVLDTPATQAGLWEFADKGLFNLPLWLPLLYGNGVLLILYARTHAEKYFGKRR